MDTAASFCESFDDLITRGTAFSPVEIKDDDLAQILYTSGTTGKPKGCKITHQSIALNGTFSAVIVKMDEDDRMLITMPIWHSSPINNWFAGIQIVGGTVVFLREYHPLHFLQIIQDEKCTAFFGPPDFLYHAFAAPQF